MFSVHNSLHFHSILWCKHAACCSSAFVTVFLHDPASLLQRDAKMKAGFGMVVMMERVKMLNGTFAVQSTIGKGTTLIAQLPAKEVDVAVHEAEMETACGLAQWPHFNALRRGGREISSSV